MTSHSGHPQATIFRWIAACMCLLIFSGAVQQNMVVGVFPALLTKRRQNNEDVVSANFSLTNYNPFKISVAVNVDPYCQHVGVTPPYFDVMGNDSQVIIVAFGPEAEAKTYSVMCSVLEATDGVAAAARFAANSGLGEAKEAVAIRITTIKIKDPTNCSIF